MIPQKKLSSFSSKTRRRRLNEHWEQKQIDASECSCLESYQSIFSKNSQWPTKPRVPKRKSERTSLGSTNTNRWQLLKQQYIPSTQSHQLQPATTSKTPTPSPQPERKNFKGQCGKTGHWKIECRAKQRDEANGISVEDSIKMKKLRSMTNQTIILNWSAKSAFIQRIRLVTTPTVNKEEHL